MKKIEVKKVGEMIVKVTIDGELYCYTGTIENAQRIAKNLDFIYNV
jgi:hypothetical protein